MTLTKEIWKDIPEYEGLYQISNLGRVKSLDRYVNGRNSKRLIKGKILSLIIEKELNIFHSRIIEVCKNKRKQIGGYVWRYADEI